MKKSEARILLTYLEERLNWVKKQMDVDRNLHYQYLTKAVPKDILPAEKAHLSMIYIDFIRWGQEELVLQKEIKRLRKKLGIEEGK